MTKRETDTSASDPEERAESTGRTSGDGGTAASTVEPNALFDALVEEKVLAVGESGGVRTTDAFDDTHAIYHDSYVGVDETEFHEAVAATFGLPDREAAAELVAERGVSRDEFVVYLAVRSQVSSATPESADSGAASNASTDRESGDSRSASEANGDAASADLSAENLAAMAGMVREVVPDSPVPDRLPDVTDDPESFLAARDRAVVAVWKRFCDPCEEVKDEIGGLLGAVPDDAQVAGIDGEEAADFCRTHDVESAPGFLLADGDERRTVHASDADEVAERIRAHFGD
ncbi:thioredoxin family protein [Halorussus salinus]|uniref:thioredoxin family protein n=1 Tax=Halorussus salinus TaxID=1364935 RepID=UPI0010919F7D|nr:thioredoxin family protein [Halorussus salinus]